ncbi:thioesterase family protein [Yinghuangia seranimata]|uniref:thioesterase family protein n=1 Tax=Yinghuangia seranimata TaxID=408067 RepID=UPI00248D0C1B|nr:hotdog domain-containing protein [Yinghuangia seranimata]MDI2128070.1 thioesterase [Yinghuangia seranimata]
MPHEPIPVSPGTHAEITHTVTDADTAAAVGSGDLAVLGTPRLLALAEAATVRALDGLLGERRTSVGTRVALEHLLATPVGGTVTVRAEVVYTDGRLVRFAVVAEDAARRLVGQGEVTRVVVDRERFLARLPEA